MSKPLRYCVEERGGTIVVCDRAGATWFRAIGEIVTKTCLTCGHESFSRWAVSDETRQKAQAECDRLNQEAT